MLQVKSALALPSGKVYFFEKETPNTGMPGTNYIRYDFLSGALDDGPRPIDPNWPGLRPTRPDAAVYWGFDKIYFFYGDEYVRYDRVNDSVDPGYPVAIAGNWNMPWTDSIDAAMNFGNGKIYIFRGAEYLRYDITLDRMDANYPKPIDGNWFNIWPDGIDAVLYQWGAKVYFFKGEEYRRYDLALDDVDEIGLIDTLTLEPVPPGMLTAARDLTLELANQVMGYLIQAGSLALSAQTPYVGDWSTAITSPRPQTRVQVKPPQIEGIEFQFDAGHQTLIDNVDQRMLIALYRLARWVNASEPEIATVLHKGIGHGGGPPNDCHNQGRALDFAGLTGTSLGASFDRRILQNWGNLPVTPGVAMRLDPAVDQLAHDLFRIVLRFGTFECECNGIGAANKWPPKEIGDVGGFVIHPDYVDVPPPGQQLRAAHQDHIHMQVGPTRV